jgi:Protein of unknown function (DUF3307)
MTRLFLLLAAHALCDYPLQGDFLARGKNRFAPLPGVPWYQCLAAHAFIHAGTVYIITGSLWFGLAELMLHCLIDDSKCAGRFGFNVDQALHVACKVLWVTI